MKVKLQTIVLLVGLLVQGLAHGSPKGTRESNDLNAVLQKKHLRVLVTDSGLGGLSVLGSIESLVKEYRSFDTLDLIFCNALPEAAYGYNSLPTLREKAEVFSGALEGMVRWYHPDLLLIACNTLSVVYPETEFAKHSALPVLGIVELGADMLQRRASTSNRNSVIIFGTETTIESNAHKQLLSAEGISASRIVAQSCPDLAGEIQVDPRSDIVKTLVGLYTASAAELLPDGGTDTVIAGLCCTHYGYCADFFKEGLERSGVKHVVIVTPNSAMAASIFCEERRGRTTSTTLSVAVVSRAVLSNDEVQSIGALLASSSPMTADALHHYIHKPDLFEFGHK